MLSHLKGFVVTFVSTAAGQIENGFPYFVQARFSKAGPGGKQIVLRSGGAPVSVLLERVGLNGLFTCVSG